MVELRVFDVQEILFGRRSSPVPGTWVITPLDTSKVFGLVSVDCPLNHPVHPQALRWAADHARDDVAVSDLGGSEKKPRSGSELATKTMHFSRLFDLLQFMTNSGLTTDYPSAFLPCNHSPFRSDLSGSSSGCHSGHPRAYWSGTLWRASSRQSPVCLQWRESEVEAWENMKTDMKMYQRTVFIPFYNVWLVMWLRCTYDKILFAVSLQSHSTHWRGGSSVDGIDSLARTFEHLKFQTERKKTHFKCI